MAKEFYNRLKSYFENVGNVLRGGADVASIFPNTSDVGLAREQAYVAFLKQHTPSKCNVYLGGFLFGENGDESKQLDVIISTDTALRYDFHHVNGNGKSFGSIEGCLGVASIKSFLDKQELIDSLEGIASIPDTKPLGNQVHPSIEIIEYGDWPYKIIYASDGLKTKTILKHINDFYSSNPNIPITKRPNIIHVAGKYFIMRMKKGQSIRNPDGTSFEKKEDEFHGCDFNLMY